jgi:hypothetical protein
MGCTHSNVERDYHIKLLHKAINDNTEYKDYVLIRDFFRRLLENSEKNIQKDVIKIVK